MASAELIPLFRSVSAPWWVAGGLAIDLFLGRTTRSHGDLDAEVLRRDLPAFAGALQGWSLFAAKDGRLTLYRGDLAEGVNGLWIRRDDDAPWAVELLLADAEADSWLYRRDHRIARPLEGVGPRASDGLPFISPEIQLLYKSKNPRDIDHADFEAALPTMDGSQRTWLASALRTTHAGHEWLDRRT